MGRSDNDFSSESARRLALLEDSFEALSDGVLIIDANGKFVVGNTRYREMFFDEGQHPRPGESALQVVRRIVEGNRVFGIDQMDPDHAVLVMIIDCYSFVQGAEFALHDGRVIQVSSSPTRSGGYLMTFRDTGRDRVGERRAAELLSDGFSSANMGMVLWDAALSIQLYNSAWQDLTLPLKIGDDVGALFKRFVDQGMLPVPEDVTDQQFVKDCLSAMHREPTHLMLDLEDGRRIKLSTFGIASGGVMATAVDISIQRDAEKQAHALLTDAVEALNIGVVHFDADLKLVMTNGMAETMIFGKIGTPRIGAPVAQIALDLIESGEILVADDAPLEVVIAGFEENIRNCDTGIRLNWSGNRTLEFSTNPTMMGGYLISMQDLTAAVNANRAASEANALVRTIVDASPSTFLVSKVDTGEIVYSTTASRERYGDITSTLSFFLEPEHREKYLNALLPTGRLNDYPVQFKRQDGKVMDGLTSARVIEYQGEKMIVSSTRDITDFLAMQKELETQRKQALQNEKLSALGELLAGVAHELSNPLSVVVGYSMMLRDEVHDAPFLQKLDRIAIAANRCVRIVKMFLALARKKPAIVERSDISQLLELAIPISDGDLINSGGRLDLNLPDCLPKLDVDPDQIVQVFSNLIVNACQAVVAREEAGKVAVSAALDAKGEFISIDFLDNGPGVPAHLHHRVFEPFFTTKDVGQGTGIGLAFSHRVITAHNGTLTLISPETGGALFQVRLPVVQSETAKSVTSSASLQSGDDVISILVLDDELVVLQLLGDVLEKAGYVVELCSDADDALGLCSAQSFDAILCDMRMTVPDGTSFYHSLMNSRPSLATRVIFMSRDTMNPSSAGLISRTGQPHLEKPITPVDVLAIVGSFTTQVTK